MAGIDHHGGGVLRRDAEGGFGSLRQARIFNTDQGTQFTGAAFTGALVDNGITISMDGKGAWRDNVFVERLWRSVKYEEVYLRAYDSVSEARASIGRYWSSTIPHHNTHLAMWLKRRGFVGRDAIPRDISGSVVPVRQSIGRLL